MEKTDSRRLVLSFAFLAVLLASIAFSTQIDADNNQNPYDLTVIKVFDNPEVDDDPDTVIKKGTAYTKFFIEHDLTIKVENLIDEIGDLHFYVKSGEELELEFDRTYSSDVRFIYIHTVIGDPEFAIEGKEGMLVLDKYCFEGSIHDADVKFKGWSGQSFRYVTSELHLKYDDGYIVVEDGYVVLDEGEESRNLEAMVICDSLVHSLNVGKGVEASADGIDADAAVADIIFGAMVYDGTVWTYYAEKVNAGTKNIDSPGGYAVIKKAMITLKCIGATIKVAEQGYEWDGVKTSMTIAQSNAGISIDGALAKGSMDITGSAAIDFLVANPATSNVSIPGFAMLEGRATVGNNITMAGKISLGVEFTLKIETSRADNLSVAGSGTVILDNPDIWDDDGHPVFDYSEFSGPMDADSVKKQAVIKGEISTVVISPSQIIEVVDDATVHHALYCGGTLIVDEGVTLTIKKSLLVQAGHFSKVENNGTIIVMVDGSDQGIILQSGQFINNGTIRLASNNNAGYPGLTTVTYLPEAYAVAMGYGPEDYLLYILNMNNKGTISVSSNDVLSMLEPEPLKFHEFNNRGTLEVYGTIKKSDLTVTNRGTIILAGHMDEPYLLDAYSYSQISILLKGGKVDIRSATFDAGTKASILVFCDASGSYDILQEEDKHALAIIGSSIGAPADGSTFTIRSLVLSAEYDDDYDSAIDVKGFKYSTTGDKGITYACVEIDNCMHVSDSLNIPKGVQWVSDCKLVVDGEMILEEDIDYTGTSTQMIIVEGKLITEGSRTLDDRLIKGVRYEHDGSCIYTTLGSAINGAVRDGVDMVTICGDPDLYEELKCIVLTDTNIPSGISIEGSYIQIGDVDEPTDVTVQEGASINVSVIDFVSGMMTVHGDQYGLEADVVIEEKDRSIYASLDRYLSEVQEGDTVVLSRDVSMTGGKLTIPKGVTVDFIAEGGYKLSLKNTSLSVEGTLILSDFSFQSYSFDRVNISVSGYMMIEEANADQIDGHWFTAIGMSYTSTKNVDGKDRVFFVITDVNNIVEAIEETDDGEITVMHSLEGIVFYAMSTEDKPLKLTMKGSLKAYMIFLGWAELTVKEDNTVSGMFLNGVDSVVLYNGNAYTDFTISSMGEGIHVSGTLIDEEDESYAMIFYGNCYMDGLKLEWGLFNDKERFEYPAILFYGQTTVLGRGNMIWNSVTEEEGFVSDTSIPVTGSLIISNGAELRCMADMEVLGDLVVKDGKNGLAGRLNLGGDLFVGTSRSDLYSPDMAANLAGLQQYNMQYGHSIRDTAGVATVSGEVEMEPGHFISNRAGGTVDPRAVEDMESMDIYVDGSLWMTVYGEGTFNLDGIKIPLKGCLVEGAPSLEDYGNVVDGEGRTIAHYDHGYCVICDSKDIPFKENTGVYLNVRYDIFTAYFNTDSSIKAVYVDDILATNDSMANTFVVTKLLAGKHTVRVEPKTGFDSSDAILYDSKGKVLEGMEFSFTVDDCRKDTLDLYYNISGTVENGVPVEVVGIDVTTILLAVLVCIIAASAVAVMLWYRRD